MELKSSAFADGGKIPQQYVMQAIGGRNVSLPFTWSDPPAGTQSFALSIVDPHPVARTWVHWLVVNIPADTRALAEGASGHDMPKGTLELVNSYGAPGYGGPQPPQGSGDHPYVCTLYALDVARLDPPAHASLDAFLHILQGHILAQAKITGNFGR